MQVTSISGASSVAPQCFTARHRSSKRLDNNCSHSRRRWPDLSIIARIMTLLTSPIVLSNLFPIPGTLFNNRNSGTPAPAFVKIKFRRRFLNREKNKWPATSSIFSFAELNYEANGEAKVRWIHWYCSREALCYSFSNNFTRILLEYMDPARQREGVCMRAAGKPGSPKYRLE